MRSLKKISILVIAVLTLIASTTAFAANTSASWVSKGGKWYYTTSSGVNLTGWQKAGGKWYYMDASGVMKTGWVKVSGKWYYLDASGAMKTGWVKVSGKWYYLDASGAMKTGWVKDAGKWYYMDASGAMKTGWVKVGGKWYYLDSNGAMATDTWIGKYYVDASGVWTKTMSETNWIEKAKNDCDSTISNLKTRWGSLKNETGTYEKYLNNVDRITAFYKKISSDCDGFFAELEKCALEYGKQIADSGKTSKEKCSDLDAIKNELYDIITDKMYEEIYMGLFDDMYAAYYNGVLKKNAVKDMKEAEALVAAQNNEKTMWTNTRAAVYDGYFNTRTSIDYFYSTLRDLIDNDRMDDVPSFLDYYEKKIA